MNDYSRDDFGPDIPKQLWEDEEELNKMGQAHRDVVIRKVGYGVNEASIENVSERRYLPTLSDLVDRLTIVLQKEIFLTEHRDEYRNEMQLIMHDIDMILAQRPPLGAEQIKAIIVIQLANAYIWTNESQIRNGDSKESDVVQLRRLKATHAVNGVRATGKNVLSAFDGGRQDYKVDCFAADLISEFGNWNVFS